MARIALEHVGLTFPAAAPARVTLKEWLLGGPRRGRPISARHVRALHDVTLDVADGERVGIVGCNGAGKSTLVKVIADVYPVSEGRRTVEGRISSLFKSDLGFEMNATGWENIVHRGYLQGETPASIRAKMPSIAEFSELGDFLDLPLRCYSAGMLVRLGFSIATAVEPEILLIDEVLSAGDRAFRRRARERIAELAAKARILMVVSHDLETLGELCNRAIWMDRGQVRQDAPVAEVLAAYTAAADNLRREAA